MEQVRFNYSDNKIQSFLAVFSFCEKHQNTHEFFYDDKTYFFLKRIKEIIPKIVLSNILNNPKVIKIEINHSIPKTTINAESKKLFFPKQILNFKKKEKRIDKVLFIGLLTRKRIFILLKFLWNLDKRDFCYSFLFFFGIKEYNGFSVKIINSNRGRKSESKFWDENYYELLSRYKYSFCPPGDFKWTYRYYESLLLDVVPVVYNKNCESLNFGSIDSSEIKSNNFIFDTYAIHKSLFL